MSGDAVAKKKEDDFSCERLATSAEVKLILNCVYQQPRRLLLSSYTTAGLRLAACMHACMSWPLDKRNVMTPNSLTDRLGRWLCQSIGGRGSTHTHVVGIISHKPHCTVAVSRRELSVLQSAAPNAATERRIVVKTNIVFAIG